MAGRVVLVTRLRSALGLSGEHDGLAVADIRHPDAVESLLADLHHGGEQPIVACSISDVEDVRRLLTFTSIRYPGFRACLEPLPGTPMGVGVVASLVDDLGSGNDADDLAWRLRALDHLRATAWSAVWLPSVSGLADPQPNLAQHIRSWFPGSGFLAVQTHGGRVISAGRAPISGLDAQPESALIHSPISGDAWVVDAVASAMQPRSVSDVSTVREQVDAFGTAKAIELVAVPLSFHSDSRPHAGDVVECIACGLRHARTICPSCKMAATSAGSPLAQGALT